ncbi:MULTISPECIES: alternative ribosome rescue aminoacyl-tRNA hydrolase ArfB [Sphingomonas]|uniref:Ribosome-associated protein n=1 Tax=Sphingomonas kyeonggiensis TaxID=1268553 RepID=A0A7W7NT79_9SPHN|nr:MULTISPECIES: alternative ribosome rescue aminoacyl-tRNA hydrolase ArfB [Sphingomonas]MBB4841010.1 ribosome-associated protein [Sphingomonas kyeonggiensis]WHU02776.1 alternative ribosome rescue aminoacyl-tRNA hydrolase ArfB [Sphingomonas sp. NIBR02145]
MAEIPDEAIVEEKFLASTGPGGQNVNKVATAVQLRIDVFRLGLAPYAYQKLKVLAGTKLTSGGELVITARKFRTQEANRADARERVLELIQKAHERDAKRIKTKPSKAAKARRVDEKKGRSQVKAGRGKVRLD